jgi:SprT protein
VLLSIEIKQKCEQRLTELYVHAEAFLTNQHHDLYAGEQSFWGKFKALKRGALNKLTISKPSILFTQRGKIAGSALLQKNIIKLHPTLLAQNVDYYLDEVIAHELSHILVYQLFGQYKGILRRERVKPHGLEWQTIMTEVFDLVPRVTHQLDVKAISMQSFEYECACQSVDLSLIRHNKVIRGKQVYYCKRCKQPFAEVTPADKPIL